MLHEKAHNLQPYQENILSQISGDSDSATIVDTVVCAIMIFRYGDGREFFLILLIDDN